MTKHELECEAPICMGDSNPNFKKEVIWCPGESICQKTPLKIKQRMKRISEVYAKGNLQDLEGMTFSELERSTL